MPKRRFYGNPNISLPDLEKRMGNYDSQMKFMQKVKILPWSIPCPKEGCSETVHTISSRQFRCDKCHTRQAVTKNTVLYHGRFSFRVFVTLGKLSHTLPGKASTSSTFNHHLNHFNY